MMDSYATMMNTPPDEYLALIRELLSYDVQCVTSCTFKRNQYNEFAFAVMPLSSMHWCRQVEWPWALIESEPQPNHRCLDVGGGWGVFKFALARRTQSVVSLESSAEFICKAQTTIDKLGQGKVSQQLGSIVDAPFANESFDRVYCISVMEHIPGDRMKCIREMQRVLKPGGVLMLSMGVVVDCKGPSDFYVDLKEAGEIADHFGVGELRNRHANTAVVPEFDLRIMVMLMRWIKPSKFPWLNVEGSGTITPQVSGPVGWKQRGYVPGGFTSGVYSSVKSENLSI